MYLKQRGIDVFFLTGCIPSCIWNKAYFSILNPVSNFLADRWCYFLIFFFCSYCYCALCCASMDAQYVQVNSVYVSISTFISICDYFYYMTSWHVGLLSHRPELCSELIISEYWTDRQPQTDRREWLSLQWYAVNPDCSGFAIQTNCVFEGQLDISSVVLWLKYRGTLEGLIRWAMRGAGGCWDNAWAPFLP